MRAITLAHLDGRTTAARRTRDLIAALETDLGGADQLSVAERQLVQRAAVLGTLIEDYETQWLAGKAINLGKYLSTINAQRRVLMTVGLQRVPKDVTDDLKAWTARKLAEREALAAEDAEEVASSGPETSQ